MADLARKPTREIQQRELRGIEDELLHDSMEILRGVHSFADLDPAHPEVLPPGWDPDAPETLRRHRVAMHALMPAKDAPIALTIAAKTASSIIKARATEKTGPRVLNMQVVNMTVPLPEFPKVHVVESEDENFGDE